MMQLELQSDCSVMEADLKDEPLWRTKWLSGCDGESKYPIIFIYAQVVFTERCTIAHEFYRMAIRVMILVNIFGLDPNQDRVQQCVIKMLDMSTHVSKCPTFMLRLRPPLMLRSGHRDRLRNRSDLAFHRMRYFSIFLTFS